MFKKNHRILTHLEKDFLIFDGAMGSLLQQGGMAVGTIPETLNIKNPELITEIHLNYLRSGAQVITTNTFGANSLKIKEGDYTLKEIVKAAIECANVAVERFMSESHTHEENRPYIMYDIGPLGTLLEPSGVLTFLEAYDYFKEIITLIKDEKIDGVLIETCSDLYEMKAAVLSVKENSDLPIFSTMTFEENGRTLAGNPVSSVVAALEGLGVNALGLNCGFGPKQMAALVKEFETYASVPIMVQPNAGLPILEEGTLSYDIDADEFLEALKPIIKTPVQIIGGCCGTTYDHIKKIKAYCETQSYEKPSEKNHSMVASPTKVTLFKEEVIKIGERINPTGKPLVREAIESRRYGYLVQEAMAQKNEGAHILDVNVGLPKIPEAEIMTNVIKEIQNHVDLPLQIDSSNPDVLESAMRHYNGKPIINSCNGKPESLHRVLPLVKQYGGMVIGLCIDENGLAFTVEEKFSVAKRIVDTALEYGIQKKDILIDPLTLTASAQQKDVKATIDVLKRIKEELEVKTVLGISNVSFGLPNRDLLTQSFLTMCLYAGLDSCIMNPNATEINNAIACANVLLNVDHDSKTYIGLSHAGKLGKILKNQENSSQEEADKSPENDLKRIINEGLKEEAQSITAELLKTREPIDIIENEIVVALNQVGKAFEQGDIFIPQLIQSAETVGFAFNEIKAYYKTHETETTAGHKIILATVQGDVHDIGKNIVKVLLENYGYDVIDLGKDVPYETIEKALSDHDVKLIGLSALMTTTVANMEDTIKKIRAYASARNKKIEIMVGGAVLTESYAEQIGSDYYCKDALAGVSVAQKVYE